MKGDDEAAEGDAPATLRTGLPAVGGEGVDRRVGDESNAVNKGGSREALPAVMAFAGGEAAIGRGKEALLPALLPIVTLLEGGIDVIDSAEGGQERLALVLAVALVTVAGAGAAASQRTLKQAALFGWDPAVVAVRRQVGMEPAGGGVWCEVVV